MVRFGLITVSFAALGLAFYEMSGDNEFDPEALRLSRIDAVELPAAATAPQPQPPEVTRVALNLTSVQDVIAPTPRATAPAPQPTAAQVIPAAATAPEAPRIIIPSPIVGAVPEGDGVQITEVDLDAEADVQVAQDVRAVTGNRVNVRGGPGTDFSVVNRLTRGAEVVILQDPGTGWVKLRPVAGGPVGWMADFLLTDAS